jgi:hypothetical protein
LRADDGTGVGESRRPKRPELQVYNLGLCGVADYGIGGGDAVGTL